MKTLSKDEYLTVSDKLNAAEVKIKGSRFITHIFHVNNKNQAELKYSEIQKKYYNATHNCFAYKIDEVGFRYSDDGEPTGTAGLPIYHSIEGKDLFQTLIVVTRHFGGIKLGTGGLSRAYSEAAKKGLRATKIVKKINYIGIDIQTNYECINNLLNLIQRLKGIISHSDYKDIIKLEIQLPVSKFESFENELSRMIENGSVLIKK